tara:strand:- start:1657 stop:2013 length:357 start_codon:yes stop_codon:yes gene_type:complete
MFTAAFTDPQGTAYKAAVCQVLWASFTENKSETFDFNIASGTGTVSDGSTNFSLNYRIGYWPTQAAKDAGTPPYTLIDSNTFLQDFADYSLDAETYAGLSAEAAAELHCKTEIIGVSV